MRHSQLLIKPPLLLQKNRTPGTIKPLCWKNWGECRKRSRARTGRIRWSSRQPHDPKRNLVTSCCRALFWTADAYKEKGMRRCADLADCGYDNRDSELFCRACALPLLGTALARRYLLYALISKGGYAAVFRGVDQNL